MTPWKNTPAVGVSATDPFPFTERAFIGQSHWQTMHRERRPLESSVGGLYLRIDFLTLFFFYVSGPL